MASEIYDGKVFQGSGLDSDSDLLVIEGADSRYRLNVITSEDSNYQVLSNVKGNTLRSYTLPSGTNIIKGYVEDKENNAGIYFIYNSNDDHSIVRFNSEDNSFTTILGEQETILSSWSPYWEGYVDAGIIGNEDEQYLVWADGRDLHMINIAYAIAGNYNDPITQEEISFYKKPLISNNTSIRAVYGIDAPRAPNRNLTGKLFQFSIRLKYFDNTLSTFSVYSEIGLPVENMPNGRLSNQLSYDFIEIRYDIQNEPTIVKGVQLLFRIIDIGGSVPGSWFIYDEFPYTTKGSDTIKFYNDKSIGIVSDSEAVRPYDAVPDIVNHVGIIDSNRVIVDVGREGYNNVDYTNSDEWDVVLSVEEETINAVDEGVFYINNEVLNNFSGADSETYFPTGGDEDTWLEFIIDSSIYTMNLFGLTNSEIYDELAAWVNGLSLPGLTAVNGVFYLRLNLAASPPTYIYATSMSVIKQTPYFRTLKTGARYKFGIEYGYNGKRGAVQTSDEMILVVPDFKDLTSNYTNYYLQGKIQILHDPPVGATDWRLVSFGSDIDYFEEYLVYFNWNDITDSASKYTIYLEEPYTVIKRNEMVNRMIAAYGDEVGGINYGFDFQKGDIIKFVGHFYPSPTATTQSFYDVNIVETKEYFIDSVNSTDIKLSSSAIREIKLKSPTLVESFWLIQIIRKKSNFNAIAEEFSESFPISFHTGINYNFTFLFADTWKSKQIFIGENNRADYGGIPLSFFSWMEKNRVSLYYDSLPSSQGRDNAVNEFATQRSDRRIQWGGQFIDDSGVNFLTKFDFDDTRNVDDRNGIITKIQQIGDVLKVYQERKVTSFYLKTTSSIDAQGNSTYVFDQSVMSVGRQSIEDYGCTHFTSYIKNVRNAYFFDIVNSVVVRDSANGFQPVSDYKMHSYFKQKAKSILEYSGTGTIEIFGGWDEDLEMYIISFVNIYNGAIQTNALNETLGFHEPSNRWITFFSYIPEYFGKISGDQLLTFKNGALYEHNINSIRNNFYGDQFDSEVWIHANKEGVVNKIFNSMEINSVNQWSCPDDDSIEIHHPISMQSRLLSGKFRKQEGIYRVEFMRDSVNGGLSPTRYNLFNGRQLRGKEITIKLKNSDITQSILESVLISSSISK